MLRHTWARHTSNFSFCGFSQGSGSVTFPWVSPESVSCSYCWLESLSEKKTTAQHPWSPATETRLVIGVTGAWCELDLVRKLWSLFEVCFPSSSLVTLQQQLDGFICWTGGWWVLAWSVWTSDLLTKKRAIIAPGRKATRLFRRPGNLSCGSFIIPSAGFRVCLIFCKK